MCQDWHYCETALKKSSGYGLPEISAKNDTICAGHRFFAIKRPTYNYYSI